MENTNNELFNAQCVCLLKKAKEYAENNPTPNLVNLYPRSAKRHIWLALSFMLLSILSISMKEPDNLQHPSLLSMNPLTFDSLSRSDIPVLNRQEYDVQVKDNEPKPKTMKWTLKGILALGAIGFLFFRRDFLHFIKKSRKILDKSTKRNWRKKVTLVLLFLTVLIPLLILVVATGEGIGWALLGFIFLIIPIWLIWLLFNIVYKIVEKKSKPRENTIQ